MNICGFFIILHIFASISYTAFCMPNGAVVENNVLRLKRSIKRQSLSDPSNCVSRCLSDKSGRMSDIKASYRLRLMMKAKQNGWSENSPQLKKEAINNVRDMLKEMCRQSAVSKNCLESCPKSVLRSLALIEHATDKDQVCFPVTGVSNFNEYYAKEECAKKKSNQNQCKQRCGNTVNVYSATRFKFNTDSSPAYVEYESDSRTNAAAAQKACQNQKCLLDCNKSILTNECGSSAFDWFAREKKYEAMVTLASLRYLGVLGAKDPPGCAYFR